MTRDAAEVGTTRQIAEFVSTWPAREIPEDVLGVARRMIIESIGVTILGGASGLGESIAGPLGFGPVPYASAHGTGFMAVANAAFVNAARADCVDSVGGSLRTPIHPGKNLIPAAVGRWLDSERPGIDLVAAVALAAEFAFRLDSAIGMEQKIRGHYVDGTIGALGAAVAVARVESCGSVQMAAALGIATLLAPATIGGAGMFVSSGRPLAMGQAAAAGILAVAFARQNIAGPKDSLERPGGFSEALSGRDADLPAAAHNLGVEWQLRSSYVKPYVGCRLTHPAREALLRLKQETRFSVDDVERIVVGHPAQDLPVVGHHVSTEDNIVAHSCSEPYLLANVLSYEDLGSAVLSESRMHDPAVHDLARRIDITANDELTARYTAATRSRSLEVNRPVVLTVLLRNPSRTLTMAADKARGDPYPDLAECDEDLIARSKSYATSRLTSAGADRLFDRLERLMELPDPSPIRAALSAKE